MKQKHFAVISLLLSALLFGSVMISCAEQPSDEPVSDKETSSPETGAVSEEAAETEPLMPNLPETDMDGKEFTVATSGWYGFEPLEIGDLITDGQQGEVLNDAVYDRMIGIQEDRNCIIRQDNIADQAQEITKIQKTVLAGDSTYDFCLFRTYSFVKAITSNIFLDLEDVSYLDIGKPWWDQQSYTSLAMAGHHFCIAGDITINDELSIFNVFFNKKLRSDYDLDNPYDLVKNGTWTYDKMFSMCSQTSSDVNGDGKVDINDKFGMTHTLDSVSGMLNSMNVTIAENQPDGTQVFTFGSDEAITKITYLYEHLCNWKDVYNIHKYGSAEDTIFMRGDALFMFSGIYMANTLRSMEDEFGILPYPKYDEAQSTYRPANNPFSMTLLGVPLSNDDLENTGIFLEDFAYRGYSGIKPAFYDDILQGKVTRDTESEEILDFIFGNVIYDVGCFCNFNAYAYDLCYMPIDGETDIASYIAKREAGAEAEMKKALDTILAFDN